MPCITKTAKYLKIPNCQNPGKHYFSIHLGAKCRQLESENIVKVTRNGRKERRYEGGTHLPLHHVSLNGLQMPQLQALIGFCLYCIDNDKKGRQYPYRMLDGQCA